MQTMGVSLDGEWESICKLLSVEETENISAHHFFDYSPPTSEQNDNLLFAPSSFSYGSNASLLANYSQANNLADSNGCADHNSVFGTPSINDFPGANEISLCMDFSKMNEENDGSLSFLFPENIRNEPISAEEGTSSTQVMDNISSPSTELTLKRKPDPPMLQVQDDKEEKTSSITTPKKKARTCRHAQKGKGKGKRKVLQKKDKEVTENVETKEETDAGEHGQSIIGCDNSEDESNATGEINETAAESECSKSVELTSTGKKRASRGAATDPQSLYARRRRMRINERLRILQSLVPNGTKVDISTMLEEAFHYVKFLQLQIRLLSSDELWMFAPLAYNGLDVGAYKRLSPFLGI